MSLSFFTFRSLPASLSIWCLLFVVGCQEVHNPHEQVDAVVQSRLMLREKVVNVKSQLDATIAALNDMSGKEGPLLVDSYEKYGAQLDLLEASVESIRLSYSTAKSLNQIYSDSADAKVASIVDTDLKTRATTRRQNLTDLAQKIGVDFKSADTSYDAFAVRLHDIQSYLSADLTSGAVRSIADQFTRVNTDVVPLKGQADQICSDIEQADELTNTGDRLSTTMSTTLPSASVAIDSASVSH